MPVPTDKSFLASKGAAEYRGRQPAGIAVSVYPLAVRHLLPGERHPVTAVHAFRQQPGQAQIGKGHKEHFSLYPRRQETSP